MALATADETKLKEIQEDLKQVLADSYSLLGQTHNCHWNVEGRNFFALHEAFEQQYTDLFSAVDEIAERIRSLDAYAPGGLESLAKRAGFEEIPQQCSAEKMVEGLIGMHKQTIAHLAKCRDTAGDAGDKETEDMMIARVQFHEKTVWMLRSFLRD
jgi:starvation-inducible DNA-binding protein